MPFGSVSDDSSTGELASAADRERGVSMSFSAEYFFCEASTLSMTTGLTRLNGPAWRAVLTFLSAAETDMQQSSKRERRNEVLIIGLLCS